MYHMQEAPNKQEIFTKDASSSKVDTTSNDREQACVYRGRGRETSSNNFPSVILDI